MNAAYLPIETEKSAILYKAVYQAILRGWQPPFEEPIIDVFLCNDDVEGTVQLEPYVVIEFDNDTSDLLIGVVSLLYDHNFARALWGDEYYWGGPHYKYHLMQMVIADDPIEYLGSTLV